MAFDIVGRIKSFMQRLNMGKEEAQKAFKIYTAVSDQQEREMTRWYNEYMNNPAWKNSGVYTLGLPQAICREFKRVVTSEMNLAIEGGQRAEYLQGQLEPALDKINKTLELGLALGGMALKPYVTGTVTRYIGLDAVGAADFIPVAFDEGGKCSSGIFKSEPVRTGDGRYYIKMEFHEFKDGAYTIQNKAFNSSERGETGTEVPLNTVPEWATIQEEVTINNVDGPLFGYFASPANNTVTLSSHVGASIYSGATEDLLREADMQWSRYIDEYVTAKRRIMAAEEAVNAALPGGIDNPLALDSLYVGMPYDNAEDFFHEFSPALRDSGFYDGLQSVLKRIEFNCGLAYGDLSDPSTVEKTAAEVINAKNRKYNTVYGIEKSLKAAIEQAVYGMDVYTTLYSLAPRGDYDLKITWDDSILEDTATERQRDMAEVSSGLMSKAEYRMKWYGEDEETAQKSIAAIAAENSSGSSSGFELNFND